MPAPEDQTLRIADGGELLHLDYAGALQVHRGESWFGVAVAFRMLQAVAPLLSERQLWDRRRLYVLTEHPGEGVRDCLEHVTRCVSRGHFHVENGEALAGCSRAMRFSWEIGDGAMVAAPQLRDDFVPSAFYELLDRRGTDSECHSDARRFAALKRSLAERLWRQPLEALFRVDRLEAGVCGRA